MWIKSGFCFFCLLAVSGLSHAVEEDSSPPAWQVEGFWAALNDENPKVMAAAIGNTETLHKFFIALGGRAKNLVPRLTELLRGPDRDVRLAAIKAIGAMGAVAKEQIPDLTKLLDDPDPGVRQAVAQAMGKMGAVAKEYIPDLIQLLRDPDPDVRQATSTALGEMGVVVKEQISELIRLLDDPEPHIRAAATKTLGVMGATVKEQIPELVRLLRDPEPHVRATAVEALGAMGMDAKDHILDLIQLLRDPKSWFIREKVVRALGMIGTVPKDHMPELVRLLRDRGISQTAAEALGAMSKAAKDYIPELVQLLCDPEPHVRAAAAGALGKMGVAAKEQIPELVQLLRDPAWDVRQAAIKALGAMGPAAKEQIPNLAELLHNHELHIRLAVIRTLGAMGSAAREMVPELRQLLHDPHNDVRQVAAEALEAMGVGVENQLPALLRLLRVGDDLRFTAFRELKKRGPVDLKTISIVLSIVYEDSSRISELRFLSHFIGGGNPHIETLIAWIGEPNSHPVTALKDDHNLAVKTLHIFEQAWPLSEPFPKLRRDLETQIATVAQKGRWKADDLPLLKTHSANLVAVGSTHAAAVQQVIASVEATDHALTIAKVVLGHMLFWLALIAVYPRSRIVQAIFFWNPWMRRFTGLGYVGFALTWVPFLRTKLFAPFKPSLVADAALDAFDEGAYFPDSTVKEKISGRQQPVREAIPAIRGQIVLEGESGIGKTMLLRSLVKHSRRMVVYLPAKKCAGGVLEAIQAKLHGPAQDPAFLRNLIYSGALDIGIDGLNEVSADARAKITGFVESYFKGNILMSTQPLEWTPPATAKTYILEPLTDSQIETFLLTRQGQLPDDARLTGEAYQQAFRRYLADTLNPQQAPETLAAMRQLLSNPMDLTLVAAMLARGENPDLFHLQRQQYRIMAEDYREKQLHDFPLRKFAEAIYQMRLQDQDTLPAGEFTEELQCLERHKMTVNRPLVEGGKSRDDWHFRHDKITDFFIVHAFLGPDNDKPEQHLGDARFRGVYLQLARLLPLNDAKALERKLIGYAADTQDHTVSDTFIHLLRARPNENQGQSRPSLPTETSRLTEV